MAKIGGRDTTITFTTHSAPRELAASVIASAVLCAHVDGILWDAEANELVSANDAIKWAEEVVAQISE